MSQSPLKTLVISCRGMGAGHAAAVASLPDRYQLVGGCDLNADVLAAFGEKHPGVALYADLTRALAELKPDVVINATGNTAHHPLTLQAARTGYVKGIYVEKPMAVGFGQAREMVDVCRSHGVYLACNHQRRMMPVFRAMRRLIAEEAIGKTQLIIGGNAGDILSDGTHFIDTLRFLTGDDDVQWVFGSVYRDTPNPDEPHARAFETSGGYRYGHPVETGGFAILQFAKGIRGEVHSGKLIPHGRWYQHYEVIGTKGRLLRANDSADPALQIQDEHGGWRPVPLEVDADPARAHLKLMQEVFTRFAQAVHNGGNAFLPGVDPEPKPIEPVQSDAQPAGPTAATTARSAVPVDATAGPNAQPAQPTEPGPPYLPHPLSGDSALKDHELVMAIYESARLRKRITLPLEQDRFPLELMIEAGQL